MADIEALYTFEGTDNIQALIVGRAITGGQRLPLTAAGLGQARLLALSAEPCHAPDRASYLLSQRRSNTRCWSQR